MNNFDGSLSDFEEGEVMEFTREAWENAPEGARLEWSANIALWEKVDLIGFTKANAPVIEDHGQVRVTYNDRLRIILPKRKVTVQLWKMHSGSLVTSINATVTHDNVLDWNLLGEHTFEIEGE